MARSTIHKLPSGNYRVRYEAPTGRWVSKTFGTRDPARRWLREELRRIDRDEWTDLKLRSIPLGDWAARWEKTLTGIKPKTRVGYRSLLRNHILPHFGNEPLNTVTPIRVQEWIADLEEAGLSASRIRQARQVLGALFGAAVQEGLVARNPTQGTRLPRQRRKEMLILSPEELERLVDQFEHPYSLITLTLAYTGMRWGELAAVRRKRIKIQGRTLHIAESLAEVNGKLFFDTTKTHRDRTLVLPAFLADLLSEHLKEVDSDMDALVFTTKIGTTLRVSNWHSRVWRPAVERSAIPQGARPHDLRHFCASVLIRSGASPVLVARQLGHSSPKVTLDIYSHLFPSDLGDMAVRLDGIRREAIATHARHAETKPVTTLPHETSETAV